MTNNLLVKYANKWIALTSDRKRVVASAKNIQDLDKKVRTLKKPKNVIYHRVLPIETF